MKKLTRRVQAALYWARKRRKGGEPAALTFFDFQNFAFSAKKETAETEQAANDWGTKWP